MVSALSRQLPDAPTQCGDCPFFFEGADPKFGDCTKFNCEVRCDEASSFDCKCAYWDLAESDRPAHEAAFDAALPGNGKTYSDVSHEGRSFRFVRDDRSVWNVSIQQPYRKLLGRIELASDGWRVINVARCPHSNRARYTSFVEAAEALLKLNRNPIDRANGVRLNQFVVVGLMAAIGFLSFAPDAIAHRASSRDLPTDPQQSQSYHPPNNSGPAGTVGSGSR